MDFVGNLLLFPAVKEFWKSVNNWCSYRHEFCILLFWDTVYVISSVGWSQSFVAAKQLNGSSFYCHWHIVINGSQMGNFARWYIQGNHSPDNVKFPDNSLTVCGTRHVKCYSCHARTSNKYMHGCKYAVYSFRQLFLDKIFSLTFPWFL